MVERSRSWCLRVVAGLALSLLALGAGAAQESAAPFDAPLVVAGSTSRIDHLLDFDGDGYMDAAGGWWTTTQTFTVSLWRNDTTGKLVGFWNLGVTQSQSYYNYTTEVAVGDLNGDGLDDILYAIDNQITAYTSNGGQAAPTLAWTMTSPTVYDVASIVTADFNDDGRDDFAIMDDYVRIFLSQPSGPPVLTSSTYILVTYYGRWLSVGEVNGDGLPDLILTQTTSSNPASTALRLYPVVNGVLGTPQLQLIQGMGDPMTTSGDIDNDGDEDVVVFGMTQYRILRRTGPASFTLQGPFDGGPATDLVDIDGDGDLDGVCCGGGTVSTPHNTAESIFRISFNNAGTFAPAAEITGLGAVHIAGAADLEHDGDMDLVGGRCVYYARGVLDKAPQPPVNTIAPVPQAVGDQDGDGDPDVAIGLYTYRRNAGDGTFASATPVVPAAPAGSQFNGPGFPGDFDGDGDTDLIVEHMIGTAPVSMRLLLNTGGGGFVDGGACGPPGVLFRMITGVTYFWQIPLDVTSTIVADFDGDGDNDLLVKHPWTSISMVWWNDGSGYFTDGPIFTGVQVKGVYMMNGDNIPDILSLTSGSALNIHLGLGAGAFADPSAAATIPCSQNTSGHVAVEDFDGDGDTDVACWTLYNATSDIHRVYIYTNDGAAAAFTSNLVASLITTAYTKNVFALDMNEDGLLDIVASPSQSAAQTTNSIFLRTDQGLTFAAPILQTMIATTQADADGDGDVDLLGLSLIRNNWYEAPAGGIRWQYGTGIPGTGNMIPVLGDVGPFRPGMSGELRVRGALGGAPGILVISDAPASTPFLGGTLLITPTDPLLYAIFYLGGTPGAAGEGSWTLPWTMPAGFGGVEIYHQVGIVDPAAPFGVAASAGLKIVVGEP